MARQILVTGIPGQEQRKKDSSRICPVSSALVSVSMRVESYFFVVALGEDASFV